MVSAVSLVRKNRWHQMFWCTLEECEDCVHILFLWKCFTESLSSFLVGSHLESLLLCISDSYIPSDCSGLVWVSVSSVSMAFYFFFFFSHMAILKYPTKHGPATCAFVFGGDMHPCSCGNWFFFFRKLNYFLQWF